MERDSLKMELRLGEVGAEYRIMVGPKRRAGICGMIRGLMGGRKCFYVSISLFATVRGKRIISCEPR